MSGRLANPAVAPGAAILQRWRIGHVNPGLMLAWLVIATVLLWALTPGLFTSYSGTSGVAGQQL